MRIQGLMRWVPAVFTFAFLNNVMAQTYNLAEYWSTTQNPVGPWSYRHGSAILPSQPTTCCGLPAVPSFAPSHSPGTFLPVFFRAGGEGTDISVHSYDPFNGGAALGEATLVWTAPSAGLADVSGYFYYTQLPQVRSNDLTVRINGVVLGSEVVSANQHASFADRWSFAFPNLSVDVGDMISVTFVRSPSQFAGSTVTGNLIISSVPEPESVVFMLLGLAIVGAIVRRHRLVSRRGPFSAPD